MTPPPAQLDQTRIDFGLFFSLTQGRDDDEIAARFQIIVFRLDEPGLDLSLWIDLIVHPISDFGSRPRRTPDLRDNLPQLETERLPIQTNGHVSKLSCFFCLSGN